MKLIDILKEQYTFTIKGDRIRGSGDFNPNVEIEINNEGALLKQKIDNKTHIIVLSKKQIKELKNSL
jgi:hypothetical protein